jgi:hypothetical protein
MRRRFPGGRTLWLVWPAAVLVFLGASSPWVSNELRAFSYRLRQWRVALRSCLHW